MKLKEIAEGIQRFLIQFEADPKVNVSRQKGGLKPYWHSHAFVSGARVGVRYVSFQGLTFLPKPEALAYLEWLRAGNVGKHWKLRELAEVQAEEPR